MDANVALRDDVVGKITLGATVIFVVAAAGAMVGHCVKAWISVREEVRASKRRPVKVHKAVVKRPHSMPKPPTRPKSTVAPQKVPPTLTPVPTPDKGTSPS